MIGQHDEASIVKGWFFPSRRPLRVSSHVINEQGFPPLQQVDREENQQRPERRRDDSLA